MNRGSSNYSFKTGSHRPHAGRRSWLRETSWCKGDLVGVVLRPFAAGEAGALAVDGVFDVAKEGGGGVTFAIGDLAYWDDANDVAVTTDGGGANKLLGKAVLAAADADVTVRIRLSQ